MAYGLSQDNVAQAPTSTARHMPLGFGNIDFSNQADLLRQGLTNDPALGLQIQGGAGGDDAATEAWGDLNSSEQADYAGRQDMVWGRKDPTPAQADPFASPAPGQGAVLMGGSMTPAGAGGDDEDITPDDGSPTWGDFWKNQASQKTDANAGIGSEVGQVGGGVIGGIYGGPAGAAVGQGVGKAAGSLLDWALNTSAASELEDKKNMAEAQLKKMADWREALTLKNQSQNDVKYQQSQDAYQHGLDLQRQKEELIAAQAVHNILQSTAQRRGLGGAGMNEMARKA